MPRSFEGLGVEQEKTGDDYLAASWASSQEGRRSPKKKTKETAIMGRSTDATRAHTTLLSVPVPSQALCLALRTHALTTCTDTGGRISRSPASKTAREVRADTSSNECFVLGGLKTLVLHSTVSRAQPPIVPTRSQQQPHRSIYPTSSPYVPPPVPRTKHIMSKFFRSASRLNKTKYSFQLSVDIKTLRLHPMHNDKEIIVSLTKGGSKSVSTQHPRKPGGAWNETLSLGATLYRDSHGRYQEKKYLLVVKHSKTGKTLATFKFDASHFASAAGTKEACEFQSVNPKDDGRLGVEVTCAFLRQLESQGSEVSSMVSSVVGDEEDDDREDEQDLSGWGSGGAVEGSGGAESAASTAAAMLPESSPASPSSPATTTTTTTPTSPSSLSMRPPPAPGVGLGHMVSQGRMPSFRRSTDLRPPRPAPSSPTKPQASSSLEETHAAVLSQKRAAEEEAQSLRTERQKEQQLQRRLAAETEETMQAMQQRVVELGEQVKDRDGELARTQEALTKKEAEVDVAREKEMRLKAQVQEAEEGREKLRRAKEEREADFEKAERAAVAEVERLQNEIFILKETISSPQQQPPQEQEQQQELESDTNAEAAAAAAAVTAATAATTKAKETNRVVMAKLEAVEKERLALLSDKVELTEALNMNMRALDKARARRDQVEEERAALALRVAEMEEQEQRRGMQQAAVQEKSKGEMEGLRTQTKELEETCRAATERVVEMAEAKARLAGELEQVRERLAATAGGQGEQAQVLQAERSQWAMEKEGLMARVAELEASLEGAKEEAEEALQSITLAKEEAAETHAAETAAALAEKKKLSTQVQAMEAEKVRLLKEIDEERQHWVAEGGAEAQGHEKQRVQWVSEKEAMLARVEELETALEAAMKDVGEERRRAAVEQEEKAAAWAVEKQGMATRLLAVEGDKARLAAALEEERQRQADEIGEEGEGRAAWVEEKEALLARVAELEGALATAREEAAALQEEATDAWLSLAQAKEDVDAHAAAERELERSLQLLQTQVIHGEGDVRAEREAREEADSEAAGAMDRLQELEEEMGAVVEEKDMYQEGLVDAKLKIAQLSEQLDSLSFQLQHFRKGK